MRTPTNETLVRSADNRSCDPPASHFATLGGQGIYSILSLATSDILGLGQGGNGRQLRTDFGARGTMTDGRKEISGKTHKKGRTQDLASRSRSLRTLRREVRGGKNGGFFIALGGVYGRTDRPGFGVCSFFLAQSHFRGEHLYPTAGGVAVADGAALMGTRSVCIYFSISHGRVAR